MRRLLIATAVAFGLLAANSAGAFASGWSVQPTPSPSSQLNYLQGVSCSSPSACIAVGYELGVNNYMTLAERWNGTKWAIQPIPSPKDIDAYLSGVDCVSLTVCTAVGYSYDGTTGAGGALVERWNGTKWSTQPTPNPEHRRLYSVSCVSASDCTAVGFGVSSAAGFPKLGTLAERWNGTKWSVEQTPNSATGVDQLQGVSCTSASACTAVGYIHNEANNSFRVLVERWNGTKWSIQHAPNSPDIDTALYGVSCPSPSACTAVGYYSGGAFAERWNGSQWSVQYPADSLGELHGVSCPSRKVCTAVGVLGAPGLAERWNGIGWSIQPTPSPIGTQYNELQGGVSCASTSACTAVGDTYNSTSGTTATLAEGWTR